MKLSEETNKHCNFVITGGNKNGSIDSKKDSTVDRIYQRHSKKK